jgi:hypothetical protein
MEQQPQQPQTIASPDPVPASKGLARCRSRKRNGARCRLPVQDPATGLCFRHAPLASQTTDTLDDSVDLSKDLLSVNEGAFNSTEHINAILSNVVELLAKGRISPRRASVITFALSLMLRSVVIEERQLADSRPQIILDAPRPIRDNVSPAATAQPDPAPNRDAAPNRNTPPQTAHEAAQNYARLRT